MNHARLARILCSLSGINYSCRVVADQRGSRSWLLAPETFPLRPLVISETSVGFAKRGHHKKQLALRNRIEIPQTRDAVDADRGDGLFAALGDVGARRPGVHRDRNAGAEGKALRHAVKHAISTGVAESLAQELGDAVPGDAESLERREPGALAITGIERRGPWRASVRRLRGPDDDAPCGLRLY